MNVLIVLGSISPSDDANTNIAKLIAQEIKEKGNDVCMLGTAFKDCKKVEQIDGISYYRILRLKSEKEQEISKQWNEAKSFKEKVFCAFKHPEYFFKLVFRFLRNKLSNPLEDLYVERIKSIIQAKKIDRIIIITSPFFVATAALKAAKNIELVWYQLDPNHTNITSAYKGKNNLIEQEELLYNQIKFAVVPKLIYEENSTNSLAKYICKMKAADFPNVRELKITESKDRISFNKEKINAVFVGTFYEDIRSPKSFFDVVKHIKDEKIVFHVIGGGCEEELKRFAEQQEGKFLYHGSRSFAAAINAMQEADILINVDNLAKNMLPSKLNDYLSTGRPIINLHPYEDSESVQYLSKYSLHLNVCTKDGINESQVFKIESFCEKYAGKKEDFKIIKENYKTSTPDFVSELLLAEL